MSLVTLKSDLEMGQTGKRSDEDENEVKRRRRQKNERAKWIHCFDCVKLVIFLVSIL